MKFNKGSLIFIICYISYTAIYAARLNLSVASPGLIEAGVWDAAKVGMLGSIFSVIYSFGRLINGALSDSKPPWIMISSGLAIVSISNICIGFFPPFVGIAVLWGANAFAQSMLWSSILCIVTALYGEENAKKKTPYMVTSVATGNILGILANTWIITKFGTEFAFIIPGTITFVCCTAVVLSARKIVPKYSEAKNISVLGLLKTKKDVRLSVVPAMLHGVMKDNISLWMTVYFVDMFNINLSESAYFVLLIPIMGFVGRMVYPFFYRLCKWQEHLVSKYSFIACALFSLPLCLGVKVPIIAAVCLSMIYMFVSLINTSFLSIYPINFSKEGKVASVSGIMDFATYLGAGISSFAYGFLIKYAGYKPMYVSWAAVSFVSVFLIGRLIKNKSE